MDNQVKPNTVAATIGMRRVRARQAELAYLDGRRRDAARRGYRGPLTRAEASQRALRALQS